MSSPIESPKSIRRLVLAVVPPVAVLLFPLGALATFVGNFLRADPPSYGLAIVFGVSFLIGVVGGVLFGLYLWHSPVGQKPRLLTIGLIGCGIAWAAFMIPILVSPF